MQACLCAQSITVGLNLQSVVAKCKLYKLICHYVKCGGSQRKVFQQGQPQFSLYSSSFLHHRCVIYLCLPSLLFILCSVKLSTA